MLSEAISVWTLTIKGGTTSGFLVGDSGPSGVVLQRLMRVALKLLVVLVLLVDKSRRIPVGVGAGGLPKSADEVDCLTLRLHLSRLRYSFLFIVTSFSISLSLSILGEDDWMIGGAHKLCFITRATSATILV